MRVVLELVRKEIAQFRRDRMMLIVILVSPVIQLIVLGHAANLDLRALPLAVYDLDHSPHSRSLTEQFFLDDYFVPAPSPTPSDLHDLPLLLDSGTVGAVVVIPRGFAREIESRPGGSGRPGAAVQVLLDGSESTAAALAARHLSRIVQRFLSSASREPEVADASGTVAGVTAAVRILYNPALSSTNFMVPGILALVLMVITMMLTSIAIVKEKEAGTLEQLIVSPLRPWQIILGKLLPFAGIGIIDMGLVLVVALLGFRIPLAGSIGTLLVLSLLFIVTTLGLGLFVSTVTSTQQEAMMTAMFFIMMPMLFLSGFIFPIENMPPLVQAFTYLLPLRYYFVIIRGVFLRGVGLEVLWPQALALLVFGVAILSVSVLRFRKRLG